MSHPQPLEGITVVEIGHSVAAPAATGILAQLGARVLKIEPPEGDAARGWGPPFVEGVSATFLALNRDKLSATANLRDEADRNALKRFIIEEADVVLQNLRAGAVEGFGLDGQTLVREKPSLIYCNINAFGHVGPMRGKPGYDPLMQAFGGIMSVTGEEGQSPIRVGASIIDVGTGLWAVIGILSALVERRASGRGVVIDTSLYETALSWMNMHVAAYLASGTVPSKQGSGTAQIVPYQAFETSDGELVVAAGNDKLFRLLCEALERPDLADDERFLTNSDRVRNREALLEIIATDMWGRSTQEWRDMLDAKGVPNAPIQDLPALMECPQMKATGILQPPPREGTLPSIGLPLNFDGARPPFESDAPPQGRDNDLLFCPGTRTP